MKTKKELTTEFCRMVAILKELGMNENEAKAEVKRMMNEALNKAGL
jgi:hypothetical protein